MDLGLKGKIALVCGGSRGIAYAAAEEFAREGCTVVICARDADALTTSTAKLEALGVPVLAIEADLATEAGITKVVDTTKARFGRVDILICNTGGPQTGPAMGQDWATWQKATELLLRSVVELTRAFVPGMRERGWGRVVAITSLAVKRPQASLVLSNSLRAAVTGYLRTLADEVAKDGVTVNSVLPGFTATERLDSLADATSSRTGQTRESVFAGWEAETPVGRLGRPDELGAVIAFLCSARAGFVTGQAILVDGGAVKSLL
jgi:3-oxoacyl-[acyl-carrier protein] reductase